MNDKKINNSKKQKLPINEKVSFSERIDDFKSEFSKAGIITLITISIGVVCVLGYYFYVKNQTEEVLITDRVATTVIIDALHNDKKNSIDMTNKYSGEKEYNFPISENCPSYNDIKIGTSIDVIKTSQLNTENNTSWNEYKGLYEKICLGKDIEIKASE